MFTPAKLRSHLLPWQTETMAKRSRYLDPASSTRQGLSSFDRAVLDLVDRIPRRRVMTYGAIAEYLGQGSPRLVARVMSTRSEPDTPWQRVLRSDGTCAAEVAERQLALLRAEGTPFKSSAKPRAGTVTAVSSRSDRVDLERALWDPSETLTESPTESSTSRRRRPRRSVAAPDGEAVRQPAPRPVR
jgi:alkylated DNA nucleotide flippase Atl1